MTLVSQSLTQVSSTSISTVSFLSFARSPPKHPLDIPTSSFLPLDLTTLLWVMSIGPSSTHTVR
jgi:hypothetical protein